MSESRYKEILLREMRILLARAGYSPKYAKVLLEDDIGTFELMERLRQPSGEAGSLEYTHGIRKVPTHRPKPESVAIYCTTFCNFGHRIKDGVPVAHECYILPPAALRAERDGDTDKANNILVRSKPLRLHHGSTR